MAKTPRIRPDDAGPAPRAGALRPRRRAPKTSAQDAVVRKFAIAAARLLKDLHCENVLLLDVRGRSDVTDYVLIGTGTSDRQILSTGEDVEELAKTSGLMRLGRDAGVTTTWLLLDFADVVVHLFDQPTRVHYDLEMLWGDAPRVTWRRR